MPASVSQDDAASGRRPLAEIVAEVYREYLSAEQDYHRILSFSGGMDSTLVPHTAIEALLEIAPAQRTRPVHILSNDTLVESPLVRPICGPCKSPCGGR